MSTSSPQFPVSRRTLLAAAGAVSLSAALAACGGDGRGGGTSAVAAVSQVDIDKAMSTATELTFWAWVPEIAQEMALLEQKYPAVKVRWSTPVRAPRTSSPPRPASSMPPTRTST
ncbi:hypothetical protein [Micromonospora sp. NPDC023888]|uniref:hypothetical protein n=1 Tax=Micromonospora sp. NPDC023888 TaxID=3155607 RepID=UPI0033DE2011